MLNVLSREFPGADVRRHMNRVGAWIGDRGRTEEGAEEGPARVKLDVLLGEELPSNTEERERQFSSLEPDKRELLRPSCSRMQVKFFKDKCAQHPGLR